MKKADLVKRMAEEMEVTKKEATKIVDAVMDSIMDGLENEGEVNVSPLGKFITKERAARKGRNPQTGDPLDIPAKTVATFKPGKALKSLVNA